ncbi:hypothetical protein PVAP13_2KG215691, partial [Panicum virgatum]
PPVVDRATGLPLILCPEAKDMRLRALMNSHRNLGRRFFKCPRNHEYTRSSCPTYIFQEVYGAYILEKGFIGPNPSVNAIPELLQEFEQLHIGLDEVKECCVATGCINVVLVLLGTLLFVLK